MELARDHWHPQEFDGPDWVPFNLWMHVQHGNGMAHRCACILVYGKPEKPGSSRNSHKDAQQAWALLSQKYEALDSIAFQLPHRCAEFLRHWQATPKLKPGDHTRHRTRLADSARRLAVELRRFPERWDYGDVSQLNVTQLMTESEQDRMELFISGLPEDTREGVWEMLLGGDRGESPVIPDVPTLMDRIAEFFEDDSRQPPLKRPGDSNADRNYFIDRMIAFFEHEHGHSEPAVIARITGLFFSAGCSNQDVQQRKAKHPYLARLKSESPA